MGLIMSQAEVATETEPTPGRREADTLVNAIHFADGVSDRQARQALIDAINVRYRSKQYRDMIKQWQQSGFINKAQIEEMRHSLARIRHCQRTPPAKAYRYMWP